MSFDPILQVILIGVNAQLAEKERKLRLTEVYNKIDAKSATIYKNKKFKKSDLLSSNRRLMFEGVDYLNHARGSPIGDGRCPI
jgi:A-kinase anchor protein 13